MITNRIHALHDFAQARSEFFYPKTDCNIPNELLRRLNSSGEIKSFSQQDLEKIFLAHWQIYPRQITPLRVTSTFHQLYKIGLDDREWIIRINRLPNLIQDITLELEQHISNMIRISTTIPVPQIVKSDWSRSIVDYDYQIVEFIPYPTLKNFDLDEAVTLQLLQELIAHIKQLHTISVSGYGLLYFKQEAGKISLHGSKLTWQDFIFCRLDEQLSYLKQHQLIDHAVFTHCKLIFTQYAEILTEIQPSLLHGDLSGHNIFTDGKKIKSIIDWEDCLGGDPIYELAFLATFHPRRRLNTIINSYITIESLPESFYTRFWLYFLRIAISKTVIRHRFGYQDIPGQEIASMRINFALDALSNSYKVGQIA